MQHAYTIKARRDGRSTKSLPCASAWIAFEQYHRLVRQGLKVRILDHAEVPVTTSQLEAAAQAEIETAVGEAGDPIGRSPVIR